LFDQGSDLRINGRTSAYFTPRQLCPEEPEDLAMPTDDRFGLDDDQRFAPASPDARQQDPEETICVLDRRTLPLSLENGQLLPQGKVLKRQVASFFEVGSEESPQEQQETLHGAPVSCDPARKSTKSITYVVLANDRIIGSAPIEAFSAKQTAYLLATA